MDYGRNNICLGGCSGPGAEPRGAAVTNFPGAPCRTRRASCRELTSLRLGFGKRGKCSRKVLFLSRGEAEFLPAPRGRSRFLDFCHSHPGAEVWLRGVWSIPKKKILEKLFWVLCKESPLPGAEDPPREWEWDGSPQSLSAPSGVVLFHGLSHKDGKQTRTQRSWNGGVSFPGRRRGRKFPPCLTRHGRAAESRFSLEFLLHPHPFSFPILPSPSWSNHSNPSQFRLFPRRFRLYCSCLLGSGVWMCTAIPRILSPSLEHLDNPAGRA